MTRFARAKGSKASNERKEEDPTPWHIMRHQLAEQLNKHGNGCEKKSSFPDNPTDMVVFKPEEEMWSEFNEFKLKKPCFIRDNKSKILEGLPKRQNEKTFGKKTNEIKVDSCSNNVRLNEIKQGSLETSNKPSQSLFELEKGKTTKSKTKTTIPKGNTQINPKVKNKSIQNKCVTENSTIVTNKKANIVEENQDVSFNNNMYKNKDKSKINTKVNRKEMNTNKLGSLEDANKDQELTTLTLSEPFDSKASHNLKAPKHLITNSSKNGKNKMLLQVTNNKKGFKQEFHTVSNKNSYSTVQTIIANGRKIEIVKFEAFWIKKEDASKLKELRKKLRDQKIPSDKIKTIMKLERRKAEKALSREKTNVCYHCRKFGHKFSECQEINDSSMHRSGICFKCGSTEHTHFECKVTHSQNFRYAVCFVCNEQGHIARQCSLNPQGQYPKGGSCHLCGEVTHLRKDCPKAAEEKPSSFVTVERINSVGMEDVSEMKTNNKKHNLVKNKVVLF